MEVRRGRVQGRRQQVGEVVKQRDVKGDVTREERDVPLHNPVLLTNVKDCC